jgi:hypothetical protein
MKVLLFKNKISTLGVVENTHKLHQSMSGKNGSLTRCIFHQAHDVDLIQNGSMIGYSGRRPKLLFVFQFQNFNNIFSINKKETPSSNGVV